MRGDQPAYLLVQDGTHLAQITVELEREKAIGVDLEADSMFHYQEKICLIQISTPLKNFLVDPLCLDDLSCLSPVFANPNIRKVFHGADYDIRSLYRDFGIEVNALFDTQIAAKFLGIRETGLASLLKEQLGVVIEKKYQKRDWSERPLPAEMRAYAIEDTRHLLSLTRILEKELRVKDRLFCVQEECEHLSKVRPVPPDGDPLFLRFKGAGRLGPRELALLESILQLRDDTARRRDLPPFKVLGNAPIMEIVKKKPETRKDLERIKGVSVKHVRTLGRSILTKIDESSKLPENELPIFPRNAGQKISSEILKKVKILKVWREKKAKGMGVDPSLVCTNNQIHSLAFAHPKIRKDLEDIDTIRVWQRRLFGREICSIFREMG